MTTPTPPTHEQQEAAVEFVDSNWEVFNQGGGNSVDDMAKLILEFSASRDAAKDAIIAALRKEISDLTNGEIK